MKRPEKNKPQFVSGLQQEEFYFNEKGLIVFTEEYHLKRGYCCKSGCKHCPYGYKTTNTE